MSEQALQAEIIRLNKVVEALMNRAEQNENRQGSDFNLFHTAIILEEQVRRRTEEVAAALRDNERITRDLRESEAKFRALNLKLRDQSIRDSLTGLFNRRYLEESLGRELTLAQQQGHSVSLIMGDIDYFKVVNDTHGHQAGDKVLKVFGELIGHNSRSRDICCRYGGEEFLLVLPNVTADKAYERAEQLRLAIADKEIEYETHKLHITASFGVATYPACATNADRIISAADAALYAAKSAGRNQVKCCGNS